MHLTSLQVKNLRAMKELGIDLSHAPDMARRRIVLLGANGAGKTSLLHAIAYLFQQNAPNARRFGDALLDVSDIRNAETASLDSDESSSDLEIQATYLFSNEERGRLRETGQVIRGPQSIVEKIQGSPQGPNPAAIALKGRGGEIGDFRHVLVFMDAAGRTISKTPASSLRIALDPILPPCVFLPADRGILHLFDEVPLKAITQPLDALEGCMSTGRKRFETVAARLGMAFRNSARHEDPDDMCALMWRVIEKYMPEMPVPTYEEGFLLWFRTRGGSVVPLQKLSDGERAVLLIFAELALRNPKEGIVLIDELEQHLHPRWQLAVLEGLHSMLPDAQLIVTTQSPYLASCAPDDILKVGSWDRDGE